MAQESGSLQKPVLSSPFPGVLTLEKTFSERNAGEYFSIFSKQVGNWVFFSFSQELRFYDFNY